LGQLGGDSRRLVQVARRSCTPVGPFAAEEARGIVEVHQRQAAVVFVVAGVEGADHARAT
jgi:hypothetical protein